MSGRHADAASDANAASDACSDAHAGAAHGRADGGSDVHGQNLSISITDAVADGVPDADARPCFTEPGARDARIDRVGGDDRRIGVDLAPLPQLVARFGSSRLARCPCAHHASWASGALRRRARSDEHAFGCG